ncbi:MAG: DnaD domain protein [Eubacteriales bacterium]|jgi:DnaD/phage-associated family protein
MRIEFDFQSGQAAFPAAAVKCVGRASDIALRLLILLAAEPAYRADFEAHAEEITSLLKCSRKELDMALGFWCGAGIADVSAAKKSDSAPATTDNTEASTPTSEIIPPKKTAKLMRAAGLPEYTSEELADMLERDGAALSFVDEAQRRLGRMLNPREISLLIGLRNYLELEDEYIFMLLDYCSRIGKTSIRYIETMAFGLYDDGVTEADALAQALAEREAYRELEGKFKAMIGARGRKLTSKETRFLNRWSVEMKYDFKMIELAYEITVDSQHEYNPAYMNGILERWYAAGITTPKQVEAERAKRKQGIGAGKSYDLDDFFEAALRRSYGDPDT